MILDGRYTIVYASGEYRSLRVRTAQDGPLAGRHILSLPSNRDPSSTDRAAYKWQGCGFLEEAASESGVRVRFWKKFREASGLERCRRIQSAVNRIAADPLKAGQAYAMKTNRCARCDRPLSVPASLAHGLGPECAGKASGRWTKKDNAKVYEAALGISARDVEAAS